MALRRSIGLICGLVLLGACAVPVERDFPDTTGPRGASSGENDNESIFGPGGVNLFGGGELARDGDGSAGIGINSFLWRASLDTLSFMPLTSADPFGGVIITDWYSPPETPNERFKATVYILDRRLRADGLRVAVFRQLRSGSNQWEDVGIAENTVVAMEDAILTRARELRIATVPISGG